MQQQKQIKSAQLVYPVEVFSIGQQRVHGLQKGVMPEAVQLDVPRDQLSVPISPTESPDETTLFEDASQPRQYYLPHYELQQTQVAGLPRYEINFSRQQNRWQLRIQFRKSMSDRIFSEAPDAIEIPHTPAFILRYRIAIDHTATRDVRMTEVVVTGDGVVAVLNIDALSLRDEIHRALTEISFGTQLLVERSFRMAVRSGQASNSDGRLFEVIMIEGSAPAIKRNRIKLIKLIRALTGLGLKQSKALVEAPLPVTLQSSLDKRSAAKFLHALLKLGLKAVARPQIRRSTFEPAASQLLLKLLDQQNTEIRGNKFVQYTIAVSNWQTVDDVLFKPAQDLPPCGSNTKSSRSWVDIIGLTRRTKKRIYGYCALRSAKDLSKLAFNVPQGTQPDALILLINDRRSGKTLSSQALKLRHQPAGTPPPRRTLPPPPPPPPPPGPPLYRVLDKQAIQPVSPTPFVFDATLHDYIFDFIRGDSEPASGLILIQKAYQGSFYSYYQDAARPGVIYYLPDAFKFARSERAPYYPEMSVSIRSTDGAQENTDVFIDYTIKPYISSQRIEQARQQFSIDDSIDAEIELQPFPMDEFRFFVSYIGADGIQTFERDGQASVLREGIRDRLQMSLAEFVPLFAGMCGAGASRLFGNIEIDIPDIGSHDIPLISLFEDMVGATLISSVQPGITDGSFDVMISNAIESPIQLVQAKAMLDTDQGALKLEIEPDSFPAELQPDESLIFSLSTAQFPENTLAQSLQLDLDPVEVMPDQGLIWNTIANRSATEFFRMIRVMVSPVLFEGNSDQPGAQILKIIVHFEGGDSVELNDRQLQQDARVDYLVDDIVLGRAQNPEYRYAVDVVRVQGLDPRSETFTDVVELLPVSVLR